MKISLTIVCAIFLYFGDASEAGAHFGAIIPSDDIVSQDDEKTIGMEIMFFHPMEEEFLDMAKPRQFGVLHDGEKADLSGAITEIEKEGHTAWSASFNIQRPGDYIFYLEPAPYWEEAEDLFIVHYTKVCVNVLGMEVGWDAEVGLETEIVPLARPYGLWTGNIFSGIVKKNGEPVPFAEIEVEYYNKNGTIEIPAGPYTTQVVKADGNGVFSYCMPKAGWWGFAALSEASWTLKDAEGNDKPVEIGAVFWVRTRDMK